MERFVITRSCMYLCKTYAAGEIITDHIVAEHLTALGFATYAPDDTQADATESDPEPRRPTAAVDKE